jgi:hypothetical protein
MIPLKKPEMQSAKFSRNEAYLAYVAVTGKLKQRRRLDFFSGIESNNMITLKKVLLRSSGFGSWKPQKMDQKSLLRIDLK